MKYRDQKFDNWFVKRCYPSLLRDYETQLYIQYCLGKEIQKSLSEQEQISRKKNLIQMVRRILNAILGYKRHTIEQDLTEQPQLKRYNSLQEDDTSKLTAMPILQLQPQLSQIIRPIQKESSAKSSSESGYQKSESSKSRDQSTKQRHKTHHYHKHYHSSKSPGDKHKYDKPHYYKPKYHRQEKPRVRKYYEDNDYQKKYFKRKSSSEPSSPDHKKKTDSYKYYRYPKVYKYDYEKPARNVEIKERSRSRQRNKSQSSDSYRRRSKSNHKSKKYYRKYQ